jgi:hypothetical protein
MDDSDLSKIGKAIEKKEENAPEQSGGFLKKLIEKGSKWL